MPRACRCVYGTCSCSLLSSTQLTHTQTLHLDSLRRPTIPEADPSLFLLPKQTRLTPIPPDGNPTLVFLSRTSTSSSLELERPHRSHSLETISIRPTQLVQGHRYFEITTPHSFNSLPHQAHTGRSTTPEQFPYRSLSQHISDTTETP